MSHIAVQRVMVRMLFDRAYADRVLATPEETLRGEDVSERERAWLLRPDPRAWRADAGRPRRALSALLQEYPSSFALIVRSMGTLDILASYFASLHFARAVGPRGSMALAFGDFLLAEVHAGRISDPRVAALAGLERAFAQLHRTSTSREPEAGFEATHFSLSSDKSLYRAPRGTADLHEAIHLALNETGHPMGQAVLEPPPLPSAAVSTDELEPLLLELLRDDGPRVKYLAGAAEITEELFSLLEYARQRRTFAELVAEVTRLGAEESEAPEVIAGLIEETILVPAR
ncbi:MAG: hypothetical protein U0527_11420 [Candidatus Eisenbacteria bacterium]